MLLLLNNPYLDTSSIFEVLQSVNKTFYGFNENQLNNQKTIILFHVFFGDVSELTG